MKRLTQKELEEYETRLKGMLALLTGDIDRLEQEALGERGVPQEVSPDGGTDSYSQEFSLELLERDESNVREVLLALDRIKLGTFGLCESCGTPILKERLRLVPHARNCIECQRKEEEGRI